MPRDPFAATFSAPDMVGLTRAVINSAPYARGLPAQMRRRLWPGAPTTDWRERLLTKAANGLTVSWGERQEITRETGCVRADFPSVPLDPRSVLSFVEPLPFELSVMPPVRQWLGEYFAPAIDVDHAFLGWGIIVKGAGHERSFVSRRWLEHAPCRVLRGAHDTTLLQFHDLDTEPPTAANAVDYVTLEQARRAHEWLLTGLLRPQHPYTHSIAGEYEPADAVLRVFVNDRVVSDLEMLDACAARRDRRHDPHEPVKNIAFVFSDPVAARAHLDALWLRGLECRTLIDGREMRLDQGHTVDVTRPPWVIELERRGG